MAPGWLAGQDVTNAVLGLLKSLSSMRSALGKVLPTSKDAIPTVPPGSATAPKRPIKRIQGTTILVQRSTQNLELVIFIHLARLRAVFSGPRFAAIPA